MSDAVTAVLLIGALWVVTDAYLLRATVTRMPMRSAISQPRVTAFGQRCA